MPAHSRRRTVGAVLLPLFLGIASGALAAPAAAQDSDEQQERLRNVERQIQERREREARLAREAQELSQEIGRLQERLRERAERVSALQARLDVVEGELAELVVRERRRSAAFRDRQQQLARIVSTLQRQRRLPTEAVAAMPGGPNTAVRTVLVLRATLPHLEDEARRLRTELRELGSLREQIEERRDAARAVRGQLEGERLEVAALLAERERLMEQTEAEKQAVAAELDRLRREARDLRELVEQLRAGRRSEDRGHGRTASLTRPSALRSFVAARGEITPPAVGSVVVRFGDDTQFGQSSHGISIETRAGAQVVAPYDGQVVFAGPFRTYGRILIIEHSDGYHTLIAGLSSIDAVVSQWVLAGEPVGSVAIGQSRPRVYLELRHEGRPINPLPWLAANRS